MATTEGQQQQHHRTLEAIKYKRGELKLLNQIILPQQFVYDDITTCEECFDAIKSMRVRGAPAIAVAAALSLAVEASRKLEAGAFSSASDAAAWVDERMAMLEKSRPTAVNLHNARVDFNALYGTQQAWPSAGSYLEAVIALAERMLQKDADDNLAISNNGADYIEQTVIPRLPAAAGEEKKKKKICMLSHCNAGALATARYGTALGVIRALNERGEIEHVYCTETRPWNQGARLSSFEMAYERIPVTLLVDSAVASLMRAGRVQAVVVGADRVCLNGDVANKIGTYSVAVAARAHGVPFFVAAPLTTFDKKCEDGSKVPIEQRTPTEITHFPGEAVPHVAPEVEIWNPCFDVTPAEFVTAIFTDAGVVTPPYAENIQKILRANSN